MTIEEIAFKVHKELGSVNKFTIKKDHVELINSITDRSSFLLFNFKKFDSSFNNGLMLSFPILWNNFSSEDWIQLIEKNFPRRVVKKNDYRLINDDENYADIIFLHKYLKIDPIKILTESIHISKTELLNCLSFCEIYAPKFFITASELKEDLNDFYTISEEKLDICKEKLLLEGLSIGFNNETEFRKRIKEAQIRL